MNDQVFEIVRVGTSYEPEYTAYVEETYWQNKFTHCKPATKKEIETKLMIALGYINANFLSKKLSVTEISRNCFYSKYHFFRCFRVAFDLSPYQYLLNKKLSYSAWLITADTQIALKDVSAMLGFADVFTYSKAFKRKYKVSPTTYRMQKK